MPQSGNMGKSSSTMASAKQILAAAFVLVNPSYRERGSFLQAPQDHFQWATSHRIMRFRPHIHIYSHTPNIHLWGHSLAFHGKGQWCMRYTAAAAAVLWKYPSTIPISNRMREIHIVCPLLCKMHNCMVCYDVYSYCCGLRKWVQKTVVYQCLNPSNAEATFISSTKTQRSLKTILTLSCRYSLDSSHWVLSDEYPWFWVSVIIIFFFIILYWSN